MAKITFSTFIPYFGNSNPNVRYFAHFENREQKELKHENENIWYFTQNRKRVRVEINGSLYHKEFKILSL